MSRRRVVDAQHWTQLRLGDVTIALVEEQRFSRPIDTIVDDELFIARYLRALPSGYLHPTTASYDFCFQSWVLWVDGLCILVDPCNGNGRSRPGANAMFDNTDFPYLERLEAAGAPARSIDVVFCTHMHHDHCGWNTQQVDGRWVPTFPNPRYFFVDQEFERWDPREQTEHPNKYTPSVFTESILPVVEAGQAEIVSTPHEVSPSVTIEASPGHTLGHAMLHVRSEDEHAYFVGDVCHHPAQVFRPSLHLRGCDDLQQAIQTRFDVFQRIADDQGFLFPAHFAEPHYGRVRAGGEAFVFEPGGAESVGG